MRLLQTAGRFSKLKPTWRRSGETVQKNQQGSGPEKHPSEETRTFWPQTELVQLQSQTWFRLWPAGGSSSSLVTSSVTSQRMENISRFCSGFGSFLLRVCASGSGLVRGSALRSRFWFWQILFVFCWAFWKNNWNLKAIHSSLGEGFWFADPAPQYPQCTTEPFALLLWWRSCCHVTQHHASLPRCSGWTHAGKQFAPPPWLKAASRRRSQLHCLQTNTNVYVFILKDQRLKLQRFLSDLVSASSCLTRGLVRRWAAASDAVRLTCSPLLPGPSAVTASSSCWAVTTATARGSEDAAHLTRTPPKKTSSESRSFLRSDGIFQSSEMKLQRWDSPFRFHDNSRGNSWQRSPLPPSLFHCRGETHSCWFWTLRFIPDEDDLLRLNSETRRWEDENEGRPYSIRSLKASVRPETRESFICTWDQGRCIGKGGPKRRMVSVAPPTGSSVSEESLTSYSLSSQPLTQTFQQIFMEKSGS